MLTTGVLLSFSDSNWVYFYTTNEEAKALKCLKLRIKISFSCTATLFRINLSFLKKNGE